MWSEACECHWFHGGGKLPRPALLILPQNQTCEPRVSALHFQEGNSVPCAWPTGPSHVLFFCIFFSISRTWKFNLCLPFFFLVILLFYLKELLGALSWRHISFSAAHYKPMWLRQLNEAVKLITLLTVPFWVFNNCFTLLLEALELLRP